MCNLKSEICNQFLIASLHNNLQFEICDLQLLLQRIIQRAFQIEAYNLPRERWVICRLKNLVVLEKIEKAALSNQLGNVGIFAQRDDSCVLAQFPRAREQEK